MTTHKLLLVDSNERQLFTIEGNQDQFETWNDSRLIFHGGKFWTYADMMGTTIIFMESEPTPASYDMTNSTAIRATTVAAVQAWADYASVNETQWTGWGDQTVPPGATHWRVNANHALELLKSDSPFFSNMMDEGVDFDDFKTHRAAWRAALEQALAASDGEANDSYWTHELKVFDRTFDAFIPK